MVVLGGVTVSYERGILGPHAPMDSARVSYSQNLSKTRRVEEGPAHQTQSSGSNVISVSGRAHSEKQLFKKCSRNPACGGRSRTTDSQQWLQRHLYPGGLVLVQLVEGLARTPLTKGVDLLNLLSRKGSTGTRITSVSGLTLELTTRLSSGECSRDPLE